MTLEEVEETLTRFQSKPGVLGTLVVTGVVAYLVLVIPCALGCFKIQDFH